MNMKRRVMAYMEKNPQATTKELRKAFPEANKKSLWNYSGQWKKQKGVNMTERPGSIRKQVFDFFNQNPNANLRELKKAFPDANQVSINNYRYQWKKQMSDVAKKKSVKEQVYSFLDENPNISFSGLRRALPNLNPSSVSAYHSQWKNSRGGGYSSGKEKTSEPNEISAKMRTETSGKKNDKELVKALKATIEAQKTTIEAMKKQNFLLKEKQSIVMNELESLDEVQLDEIKRIMSTYIKGMRKL